MSHTRLHGPRHGAVHGAKHGVLTLGSGPSMATVSRDATSNIYCPASAAEWTTTLSVAGIGSGNPASLWLMQEASGNLTDSIDGVTLTQTGAGHLYQQAVTGWSRKAVQTVDGTAGQKWLNNTTAPNPNTHNVLIFTYLNAPSAAPAAARDIFACAAAGDLRFNTTGKFRPVFGATADLVNVSTNRVMPVIMKIDNTNSISAIYTDQEKFIGTYAAPASASLLVFGGQTTLPDDTKYLYAAQFVDAAAQLSDAQVKTLLQTLGWTIPWT